MKKTTKSNKVSAVPEGFTTVTSYLVVDNADDLIHFIEKGLGGKLVSVIRGTENRIANANVRIGNSMIMVSDTMADMPPELAMMFLYVEDADAIYKSAIREHAESIQAPKDEFYGDRVGGVKDRWGNKWWIATHQEDIEEEELERRAKAAWKEKEPQHAH